MKNEKSQELYDHKNCVSMDSPHKYNQNIKNYTEIYLHKTTIKVFITTQEKYFRG